MEPNDVLKALAFWSQNEILTDIDVGFAEFLHRLHPEEESGILLAAALTSKRFGLGHICFDPELFLHDPLAFLGLLAETDPSPEQIALSSSIQTVVQGLTVEKWLDTMAHSKVIGNQADHRPLVLDDGRLYLTRNWRNEQSVAVALRARLTPTIKPFDSSDFLTDLFKGGDPERPGPNMQKVATALATRGNLLILTGGPGTGKTFTVVRILALLLHQKHDQRILLAAPTGKAAARLNESIAASLNQDALRALPDEIRSRIPSKATTIHQMLRSRKNSRRFYHNAENPLHADVVVIDEASMIDLEMMATVLKAIPPKALLVVVGDKDQLSSVEAGSVMGDLCIDESERGYSSETLEWIRSATGEEIAYPHPIKADALAQQTVMLRHSVRFDGSSGIGQLAQAVNRGDSEQVLSVLQGPQNFEDVTWIQQDHPSKNVIENICVKAGYRPYLELIQQREWVPSEESEANAFYAKVLGAFGQFQVLAAVREGSWGVENLNKMIQRGLEKSGLIKSNPDKEATWFPGRPVMVTRNDHELGIMNGDVGITLPFQDEATGPMKLRVVFNDPENPGQAFKLVLPSRLTDVETVFAMTVHKSQGSEFGHVALMLPDPEHAPVLTRELLYTGITRAKKTLTLVGGNDEQLKLIIERKIQRSSRLGELMTK